jgi:hypothetical protein
MAQGLSVLARLLRKGAFSEFETGLESRRFSAYMPARRGFTRGSLGSTGVRSPGAPQTRNSDAQVEEERAMIRSSIMKAFTQGLVS